MVQALLPEGPSTYSVEDMDAAGKLAEKVVANYGMTDLGILAYAPPPGRKEFGKRSFEVGRVLVFVFRVHACRLLFALPSGRKELGKRS